MSSFHTIIAHIFCCADCANDEHLMSLVKDYRYAQSNPNASELALENHRSLISYYIATNIYYEAA